MYPKLIYLCLLFLWISLNFVKPKTISSLTNWNENSLRLIVDYVTWRKIGRVVFIDPKIKNGDRMKLLGRMLPLFENNGIYISIQTSLSSIDALLKMVDYNSVAVATFIEGDVSEEDIKYQASKLVPYRKHISWMIIASGNFSRMVDSLRDAQITLNSDIVIVTRIKPTISPIKRKILKVFIFIFQSNIQSTDKEELLTMAEIKQNQENVYFPFIAEATKADIDSIFCNYNADELNQDIYCIVQVYKIRERYNTSLALYQLGFWTSLNTSKLLRPFLSIDKRYNFHNFPLIIGRKNTTKAVTEDEMSIENDDDDYNMAEFLLYFISFLNSSLSLKMYPKLGSKGIDGQWSDLFGDLINEDIDITYDGIIKTLERCEDMCFTHDIMMSMRNIYIQPEESSDFRDIFLQPFDSRLILCVLMTGIIFSIAMTIIQKISHIYRTMDQNQNQGGFSECIVWCIGVFSQQGSIFKPKCYSDQIIVLIALAFTLLIYNSYSAFITSVLSVTLPNIRTVDDLLNSDYDIGYAKNSQDEVYLRLMNNTQLNQIYLRGYLHNDVMNITDGLLKVTRGNYGFFASSQIARKQLQNISHYKCMYDIDELPIKYTLEHVGFAMGKTSPYKSLINLSIIKMFESGIYKYLYSSIYPSLPACESRKTFQSAGLTDLTTAFSILILGHIFGLILMILECIWLRRQVIYLNVKKKFSRRERFRLNPKHPFTL